VRTYGVEIETRVLKNPGPGTRPFRQTRNPGLRAAESETRVSGLCFSAAFCTFQQQIVQQFNAIFTSYRSETVQMSFPAVSTDPTAVTAVHRCQ